MLCYIMQSKKPKPFVVGIYMGKTRSNSHYEYMDQFVTETKELLLEGILCSIHRCELSVTYQ